jgi:hypothetical protein
MNNEELSKTQAQVSSHQEMTEEQLDAVNAGKWAVDNILEERSIEDFVKTSGDCLRKGL